MSLPEELDAHAKILHTLQSRTPARLLVGRSGTAYRTTTQLELREDHAAAVDAVHAELPASGFLEEFAPLRLSTCAHDKEEYLLRPDLGRRLSEAGRSTLQAECARGLDLQIAVGDGLSVQAVLRQVPPLLPMLVDAARHRGWSLGRLVLIQYCRVGILNDLGKLLDPGVVVLLIGERPGLATAESLSAYLAYRPRTGHTDAQRNLISNIHPRGVSTEAAVKRIIALVEKMRGLQISGVAVKEDLPAALLSKPEV